MLAFKDFLFAVCEHVACMGACFGSCSQSPDVLSAADQTSKLSSLPKRRECHTKKDFWSSSSNEGDVTKESKSSQRSLSSSKQIQSAESCEAMSPSRANVNHGLALWTEQRKEWTEKTSQSMTTQTREPVISWSSTYEDLLSTSRPFAKPIPLPEMVNFLVGVWEQEGLYD